MTATNAMSHKGYFARVEFEADDGLFVGRIAGINNVLAFHADSVAQLVEAFRRAVDDYVAPCKQGGKALAAPLQGNSLNP